MVVRLQDSTKKKREYLPPFMIASYFYGDEKGNIVNIIWWLSFLSNAAVYVEFVSTIINMQYKGYCLNMAQHLRLRVARKIKFMIFKLIWGILFHNLNVNGSIFSITIKTLSLYAIAHPYQAEYQSSNLLQTWYTLNGIQQGKKWNPIFHFISHISYKIFLSFISWSPKTISRTKLWR